MGLQAAMMLGWYWAEAIFKTRFGADASDML